MNDYEYFDGPPLDVPGCLPEEPVVQHVARPLVSFEYGLRAEYEPHLKEVLHETESK